MLVAALVAATVVMWLGAPSAAHAQARYPAVVTHVVEGDSVDARLSLGAT